MLLLLCTAGGIGEVDDVGTTRAPPKVFSPVVVARGGLRSNDRLREPVHALFTSLGFPSVLVTDDDDDDAGRASCVAD